MSTLTAKAALQRDLLCVAVAVEGMARAAGIEIKVTSLEQVTVLVGPRAMPKDSSPGQHLIEARRAGVLLEEDYLLVLHGRGFQTFQRDAQGRWVRRTPRTYSSDLRAPLLNLFQGIMWDRMKAYARSLPTRLEGTIAPGGAEPEDLDPPPRPHPGERTP
jgi:hypothetical protein